MKIIYENFEELADEFSKKNSILWQSNCKFNKKIVGVNEQDAWKEGIKNFAEWLDYVGIKIRISDSKEDFYWFKNSKYHWKKYE